MDRQDPLASLFNPSSVAVVGASEVPGKAAERRTRSLLQGGFAGGVYLINPKRSELFGRRAYPALAEIDGSIDLAMIVIPGKFIPQAVAEAAARGARSVVIITAGLGESGPEGKKIEAEIMAVANEHGINVVGPNCSGMYSATAKVNLLGIPNLAPGRLAILAQSGNIIDALTHLARLKGRGFSRIISLGNAIGARFHDYINFLAADPETEVIMLYLESIKFGDELVKAARRAAAIKPIVALKVGRSTAGQRASASHTGALAADDRLVEAAFKQAGIIRVSNVDEMFELAETFLSCPRAGGRRVAILSEGGGDNSVAADNAERWGLEVPVLDEAVQALIRPHLLAGMPAHNPIDYGGTAEENPLVIAETVREVMSDDKVDMVYLTGFFGGFQDIIASHVGRIEVEAAQKLVGLVEELKKPLVVHTAYARDGYASLKVLQEGGVPVLDSSDRAAQKLAALGRRAENAARFQDIRLIEAGGTARPEAEAVIARARAEGRANLLETEARQILAAYGFELPPAVLARTPEEAGRAQAELGRPVACKIVCPDIVHKSEAGGVKLNLATAEAAAAGAGEILDRAARVAARERIVGCLVSPMAEPGQEIIVGFIRNAQFGPVVMFGLGGILVEVLKDVSFGICPLTEDDVERMITSIKGFPVLTGVRGQPPRDLAAIRGLIARLSIIGLENPEIAEIDLNPVIVHEQGATLVDARIILSD